MTGVQTCALPICPFKVEGVLELTPVEDASLQSGSPSAMTDVVNEDGTITQIPVPTQTTNLCPHDEVFFATPGYEDMINAQRAEINQRNAEAAAAAQAAAEAAAQAQSAQQPPAQ